MSIADKQVLMNRITSILSENMTVNQLNASMQLISESLGEFEVERTEEFAADGNSQELIDAFIDAKEIEGRSVKTIERYRYCIDRMRKSVNVPISQINVYHIRKYLMDEKAGGSSDRTVEGYRNVMSSFFGWLHREGLIQQNPCGNIGAIKCAKKMRKPLSDVDLEQIKEVCDFELDNGERCTGVRNKAIVAFLLSSGCRVSEVCELNRDNIDLSAKECKVHGKGNKERIVYINDVTVMLLKRYLDSRTDDCPALFIGKRSDRLTPGGIRFMLKGLEKKAGVENVHPHRFRRTLATNLVNHGMPIQEVAAILGHEKLDTTMKYIYVSQENVRNSYNKYA